MALDLLSSASTLEIDGHLISDWELDGLTGDDSELALVCSYTSESGYIYEFRFTEGSLKNATLTNHYLSLINVEGTKVVIGLYRLIPFFGNKDMGV